jgi:hypothetical protein
MSRWISLILALLLLGSLISLVQAIPIPSGSNNTITDRKNFIPTRKFQPLPGKAIGVLVFDAQPVLAIESRGGPENQMCFGVGGNSYRWIYLPVEDKPAISFLYLPVGEKGERKRFDKLSLASTDTLKPIGIRAKYALVEVEVNAGLGSPASDSFAATKIKLLDGSMEYPLEVEKSVEELRKKYDDYLRDEGRKIDAAIVEAAEKYLKDEKPTGPRERSDLMFLTWMPDSERLRVHFRTRIFDGAYKYAGGLNIDLGPAVPAKVTKPGDIPPPRLPNGLRYGKQYGIEFGAAYEVSKSGKLERTLILPIESFQNDLPMPKVFPAAPKKPK